MIVAALAAAFKSSGSDHAPTVRLTPHSHDVVAPEPERCEDARRAVPFYRAATWRWQDKRAGEHSDRTPLARHHTCHWVRYVVREHRARAKAAHRAYRQWRRRIDSDPAAAICSVFGPYCSQAIGVAKCESGYSMTPRAHNGQYLGTFQMGSSERRIYGHGDTVLEQARAAYRYFIDSGRDWSPWACRWAAR